jgi:hypothetical protein
MSTQSKTEGVSQSHFYKEAFPGLGCLSCQLLKPLSRLASHFSLLTPSKIAGCCHLGSLDLVRVGMAESGLGDVEMSCGWVPAHGMWHELC